MDGNNTSLTNKKTLELHVQSQWHEIRRELKPGESLIVGRAKSADIVLPSASVSQKHLEISWNGQQLQIRDLNSSNGTFRMPQNSPFQAASFGEHFEKLELLLSKEHLCLSWKPLQKLTDRTEVLDPTQVKTEVLSPPPEKSRALQRSQMEKESRSTTAPATKAPPPISTLRPSFPNTNNSLTTAQALSVLLSGIAVALASYPLWSKVLGGLLGSPQNKWASGLAYDVFITWHSFSTSKTGALTFTATLIFFVTALYMPRLNTPQWLKRKRYEEPHWIPKFFMTLGVTLWLGAGIWPALLAWSRGATPSKWNTLITLKKMHIESQKDTLIAQSTYLREQREKLEGSTLLYLKYFEVNKQRVILECDGQNESSWDKKKVCLVLLSAVGIETLDQVRPAFYREVAGQAALVLSLDGIVRVISAEGLNAPSLSFFLNSLDIVGLEREREDISKILFAPNAEAKKVAGTLQHLKLILERRVMSRQKQMNVPSFMEFSVPSSVELGI